MTEDNKDLDGPKSAAEADPFHPKRVMATTSTAGIATAVLVIIGTFIESWSLLTSPAVEVAPDLTTRQVGMLMVGGFSLLSIWLAVEVALSHRRWAASFLFLLALFGAVATFLAFFDPEAQHARYPEAMLALMAVVCGFWAVRGTRQIAAGKFIEISEAEAQADADAHRSHLQTLWTSLWATPGERLRTVCWLIFVLLILGFAVRSVWERATGVPDEQPQAAAPQAIPAPAETPQEAAAPSPTLEFSDMLVPLIDLEGLSDPPQPATIGTVAARARELCNVQGTAENPVTMAAIEEMAAGQVAAYDALAKYGFNRTRADDVCYADALEIVNESGGGSDPGQ